MSNSLPREDIKYTDGEYRAAGETGELLVVTGRRATRRAAQQEAYDRAKTVILPNKFYRDDIGDRWYEEAGQLARWGYLQGAGSDAIGGVRPGVDAGIPNGGRYSSISEDQYIIG